MKRYSHLLAGASWRAEYGDPDIPEEWSYLKYNSAYHNIDKAKAPFPKLLMTTSTKDDRVHPYHARSFVKRLQELGVEDVYYYENIEGGHGGAADAKQSAYVVALYQDFLFCALGGKRAGCGDP
jgi:prolyl oligopeptidase